MKQERCVEQLYPSSKYTIEDIRKELLHKIKSYPKNKANVQINLNENGIYVARISFLFEENKKLSDRFSFFRKMKNEKKIEIKEKNKKEKIRKSKYEQYLEKNIEVKPI